MIKINENVSIVEDELVFTASHSSGPGGQNVNKLSTRMTLWFDVAGSSSLSDDQKRLIMSRLSNRINKEGLLWIVSQQSRSQASNRVAAIERFAELLREAVRVLPPRKKTRIPFPAKQNRLNEKKQRSRLKRMRSRSDISD